MFTMSKQRVRIIGKRKFNEETKTVSIRVPISKHNDIKNLVKLLVDNILKGNQIRIQTQRKNGIIRDILNEIENPNEEETQPQETTDLRKGFSEFLGVYKKIRKKINDSISGLLNAEGLAEILNGINLDLIKKVKKNLNNPNNSTKKGNPNNPKIRRIHPFRVKSDIMAIKGYLSHVPLDIAPNDDKGIYFKKAQQFVESIIKKYEKLAKKKIPNNPHKKGSPNNLEEKLLEKINQSYYPTPDKIEINYNPDSEEFEVLIKQTGDYIFSVWNENLTCLSETFLTKEIINRIEKFMSKNPGKKEFGNPEITEKDLKNFKEEIYINMLESFDLLNDLDKLETFLSYLTEEKRNKLYSHKLLDHYDLLP